MVFGGSSFRKGSFRIIRLGTSQGPVVLFFDVKDLRRLRPLSLAFGMHKNHGRILAHPTWQWSMRSLRVQRIQGMLQTRQKQEVPCVRTAINPSRFATKAILLPQLEVQHTSCGSLADELRGIATQKLKLLKSGQEPGTWVSLAYHGES